MKKKVGIITYHNALNYGAAFQAIATYSFLTQNINQYDFEIIDYRSPELENKYTVKYIFNLPISNMSKIKRILGRGQTLYKKKKFERFFSDVKHSKRIDSSELLLLDEKYQKIVIGSDQLWNFTLNKGDTTYLLPMVENKSKISTYATSIGTENIEQQYVDLFRDCVSNYGHISVREEAARELVYQITGRTPDVVLDPVFLLDESYWQKYIVDYSGTPFVTQYLFRKENQIEMKILLEQMNKSSLPIKKIAGGIKFSDYFKKHVIVRVSNGPIEFLNDIYHSNFIFTDSFHCVAMSIIFHKPFVVFLSGNNGPDSRIVDLLQKVGLSDCIYKKNMIINSQIDWESVDKLLERERQFSREYLIHCFI